VNRVPVAAAGERPAKVFFGWWVVLASVVCIIVGYSSFVSVAFGLFIKSLEAEFGWTRMQLSYAGTLATGSIVVLAPIAGALTDRFGARRVLLPSLFLLGLVVASLALLNGSLVQFYLLVTLVAVAGMGTQPPVFSRMVVSWFDRQRGLALGISLAGVGLAGMVLPSILQPLIAGYGWRTAYVAFGLLVICVAFPLAFFVMRDTPASMGLAPDGRAPDAASDAVLLASEREGLDVPAAMRDRAMWQMLVAFGLMGLVSAGFFIHLAPMVGERGLGMSAVALMLGLKGGAVVAGRVLCGVLVDRFFAPYIAGAFILCTAVGLALISGSTGLALSGFAVVLIGLGLGAEFDLMAFLISRYLGFRAYGRLYGIMYAVFGIGGAIGPVAVGLGYQRFGSYGPGLMILAAAPVIAALLLLLLGPYRYAAAGHGKPPPRGVVAPAARIGDAT
jgi:sugar phosphate permease